MCMNKMTNDLMMLQKNEQNEISMVESKEVVDFAFDSFKIN